MYYGIQLKDNVNTTVASDAAVRQYTSGTAISDGRPAAADPDISVTNPESYTDNSTFVVLSGSFDLSRSYARFALAVYTDLL